MVLQRLPTTYYRMQMLQLSTFNLIASDPVDLIIIAGDFNLPKVQQAFESENSRDISFESNCNFLGNCKSNCIFADYLFQTDYYFLDNNLRKCLNSKTWVFSSIANCEVNFCEVHQHNCCQSNGCIGIRQAILLTFAQ